MEINPSTIEAVSALSVDKTNASGVEKSERVIHFLESVRNVNPIDLDLSLIQGLTLFMFDSSMKRNGKTKGHHSWDEAQTTRQKNQKKKASLLRM